MIGFVFQGNASNRDEAAAERWLRRAKPVGITVLNNPAWGQHLIRNIVPDTQIYLRHYDWDGDENDLSQYDPEKYFDLYAPETLNGALGLQIANEPGFTESNLALINRFAKVGIRRNIPMSLGDFPVGNVPVTWDGWETPAGAEFAELACRHPQLVKPSFHDYFLALATSGMVTPNTPAGASLWFKDYLVREDQWPTLDQIVNLYHCGRGAKSLHDYAMRRGWPKPAIHITEAGADMVDEGGGVMSLWAKSLPYDSAQFPYHIRGYKTLVHYWRQQYPTLTLQQVFARKLKYLKEEIWMPLGVEAVHLFTWWNSGQPGTTKDWRDFDCATDIEMQEELIRMNEPTAPAPYPTFPADFDERATTREAVTGGNVRVREYPSTSAAILATISDGATFNLILPIDLRPEEWIEETIDGTKAIWVPVKVNGAQGFAWDGVLDWVKPSPYADLSLVREQVASVDSYLDMVTAGLLAQRKTLQAIKEQLDKIPE